ncbi:PilZ domain-containing protein [Bradyrhizobium sp. TZ2]
MIVDEPRTKVPREPRREVQKRPTWMSVDDGITKIECFVLDVSPSGAKIVTDAAIDVRDNFVLALVPQHPKRQACEVVWRRGPDLRHQIPALIRIDRALTGNDPQDGPRPAGSTSASALKPQSSEALRRIVA